MKARIWIPLGIAIVALGLLGYGASAFFGDLRSQKVTATSRSERPLVRNKKRPKDYGLPEFSTAYAFRTSDDGTSNRGSSAFSVRRGTAKEIAAFYRKTLSESWVFKDERPAKQRPGTGAVPNPPTVTGLRQEWVESNRKRRLRVLALDFIQLKSTAQVAISWFPNEDQGEEKR
jgi:hypothetical protein